MKLSKEERKEAREKIEDYHKKKQAELLDYVVKKIEEYKKGKVDVFEMDYIIHIYHKQSQELFSFINTFYPSNDRLHLLLDLIKEEEGGGDKWQPKIKQEKEERI